MKSLESTLSKIMQLKYPLHYYDESGRMKPPVFVYILLFFVCRGLIVLIVSLSFTQDSERLLRVFYPLPYHFYLSLLPIMPALLGLYFVSKRTVLWSKERYLWFKWLPWCLYSALIFDGAIQLYILDEINFMFSMTHGVSLLIVFCGLIYLKQSRYMSHLIKDWTSP
ncbi:MAG: hypothetical protein ACJA0G_001086 [Kangiellaceae bacterium]